MNRIVLILLLLSSYLTSYGQEKGFTVKGKIDGVKNGSIAVIYTGPYNDLHKVDTIEIKNHKFQYKGIAKETKFVYMLVNGLDDRKVRSYGFPMFLDNSQITVNADVKDLEAAKIKGSELNDNYVQLLTKTDVFDLLRKNELDLRMASDKKETDRIEQLKKEQESYISSVLTYLESQPGFNNNLAVAYLIYDRIGRYLKGDRLLAVLDKFSPTINQSVYFTFLRNELFLEQTLAIGNPAPDFSLTDLVGNKHDLKDYRGEYVLLDFGASWCLWCKKEKPFLLNAHARYKDKGLKIINISMDKNRSDWEEDIKKENYPWISISDLKAWGGNIAKDYGIKGIPNIMLIDKNGKIVAKNLRGENIEKAILTLLNQDKKEEGFEINGRIKGMQDGKVFLVLNVSKERKVIDSAIVSNEQFVLRGKWILRFE